MDPNTHHEIWRCDHHLGHPVGLELDGRAILTKIIYGGSGIHVLIMLDGTIMLRSLLVWSVLQWPCALMTSARALSSFPSTWESMEQHLWNEGRAGG